MPPSARKPVLHRVYGRALQQGDQGDCVLATCAGVFNTHGGHVNGQRLFTAKDALDWYGPTTRTDPFPGAWPDQDTGTDMTSAAKYLRSLGLVQSFFHIFTGAEGVRDALQTHPVAIGVAWRQGMLDTDRDGFVTPTGQVVGGHETYLRGDPQTGYVIGRNSWNGWGVGGTGDYKLRYEDLETLLRADGDATVLVRA